jgi:hypothetical protein
LRCTWRYHVQSESYQCVVFREKCKWKLQF